MTYADPVVSVGTDSMRRRARIWAAVVLPVVLVVAVVWAAGGFERGTTPYLGSEVRPGELVSTRFWDVRVHSASVSALRTSVDVEVELTNKTRRTAEQPTRDILAVRLDDGTYLRDYYCRTAMALRLDPLIPLTASCVFDFTINEVPSLDADTTATVVVLDQEMGDSLLMAAEPVAALPAAHVPVDVTVEEEW